MNVTTSRLPDVLLERYLLGELPPSRRREIDLRLETDPGLAERLQRLRDSNRSILAAHPGLELSRPPARTAEADAGMRPASPTPRAPRRGPAFRGGWLAPTGAAFASLVVLAYFLGPSIRKPAAPPGIDTAAASGDPAIRLKGAEAGLAIYRKSRAGSELLPPHSLARPGDTLQVFYRSLRDLHGIIFSVDGNGAVTLHLPEADGLSAPLARGDFHSVPHAYLLDKAPRMERFYLVTSPSPFAVGAVLDGLQDQIRSGGPPDSLRGLPDGFRQYAYTLRKAGSPAGKFTGKGARP